MTKREAREEYEFRRALVTEELENPLRWWWLSFADGPRFLGAVMVEAHGILTGLRRAGELGINPGGECRAKPLPKGKTPPAGTANRLLSKADIEAELGGALRVDPLGEVAATPSEALPDGPQ